MPPRAYGSVRLATRPGKSDRVVQTYLSEAKREATRVGPCTVLCGGACCLACRRYLSGTLTRSLERGQRAVPAACPFCGRLPERAERLEGVDG